MLDHTKRAYGRYFLGPELFLKGCFVEKWGERGKWRGDDEREIDERSVAVCFVVRNEVALHRAQLAHGLVTFRRYTVLVCCQPPTPT